MEKDLTIIIRSTRDDPELRRQVLAAGADKFFGKEDPSFTDWAFSLEKGQVAVLVDDTEDSRAVVQDIFRVVGIAVHAFTKSEEALAQIPNIKPDVVITDFYMPRMTGIELTRRLRELYPQKAKT